MHFIQFYVEKYQLPLNVMGQIKLWGIKFTKRNVQGFILWMNQAFPYALNPYEYITSY